MKNLLLIIGILLTAWVNAQVHTDYHKDTLVRPSGYAPHVISDRVVYVTANARELLFESGNIVGNTIYDTSGNDNDATIWTRCTNVMGGYWDYGTTTAVLTGAMTISFWAKGQSYNTITSGVGRIGNSTHRGYNLGISSTGSFYFYIAPNATSLQQATATLNNSDSAIWVHYMGVYSPSNYIRIYRNGVQVGQLASGVAASQYSEANSLCVGAWGDGDNKFAGQFADVRIYDTCKTYAEVAAFDTNDIVFWDMMSYAYLDTIYSMTGHKGVKKIGIVRPEWQSVTRYPQKVVKSTIGNGVAYTPYKYDGTNLYATYKPLLRTGEDTVTIQPNYIYDNDERITFKNDSDLINADEFKIFYRDNYTSKYCLFNWLTSDIEDYYDVTYANNNVTNIKIYETSQSFDSINLYGNWGQSNAVGQWANSECPDSLKGNLQAYTYVLNNTDTLNVNDNNNNQYPEKKAMFGYELSLAKELNYKSLEKSVFAKFARGGTAIHELKEWYPNYLRYYNFYDSLLLTIDQTIYYTAKNYGLKAKLRGIVQYQGESDALNESEANIYQTTLGQFYTNLNTYFGDNTIKSFIVKPALTVASFPYRETIKTAIINYTNATANSYMIDGEAFGLSADNLHHSKAGYIGLGKAVADTIYVHP